MLQLSRNFNYSSLAHFQELFITSHCYKVIEDNVNSFFNSFEILTALLKNIFKNNLVLFSLASKELIAVGIVTLSLTIT